MAPGRPTARPTEDLEPQISQRDAEKKPEEIQGEVFSLWILGGSEICAYRYCPNEACSPS